MDDVPYTPRRRHGLSLELGRIIASVRKERGIDLRAVVREIGRSPSLPVMTQKMSESPSHRRAKGRAPGQSETRLPSGRRLDSKSPGRATEVERSGSNRALRRAAGRLKESGASQKVLQVPEKDMGKAAEAMKEVGVRGTVKNMGGTKRRSVRWGV
jgi:hypothetical protein